MKYLLAGIAVLVIVVYAGILLYFDANEDRLFWVGTRLGTVGSLPDPASGLTWDSLRVEADDGVPVFLLQSRTANPEAPWVLYFHGGGNMVGGAGNVEHYSILNEVGFNVLAVEYRGFGVSRGLTPSEDGLYADADAGWTYLTDSLGVRPDRIVLFSSSFGGGLATMLAARKEAAGLVTKGAFTSAPAAVRQIYPWLPADLIMHNRFDNLSRAEAIEEPWLLLHARDDEAIPLAHARALAAEAPRARLVVLDGGHNNVLDAGYRERVVSLLLEFKTGIGLR